MRFQNKTNRATLARVTALAALLLENGLLAAQSAPQITSPTDGALVPSGTTLAVTVEHFDHIGDNIGIQLSGTYADGSKVELTHSTRTTYAPYYDVATVDSDGVVTATHPGYGIIDIHHGQLDFVVQVWVADPVSVSPDWGVLHAGGTMQFVAQAEGATRDAFMSWSLGAGNAGSIDATGLYSAPSPISTPQTVTVTATDATNNAHKSSTIWLFPPATLSVTPAAVSLGPSGTQSYTATVTNPPNALVLWSASPDGAGTIDPNTGVFTAPDTIASPQTVTVTATAMAEPPITATATVSLNAIPDAISTPDPPAGPASGATGTLYQFTASGAVSSLGTPIQYSFNCGDGLLSGWTQAGVTSSFHSWAAPGTYAVAVIAGSTLDPTVLSRPSPFLTVVIGGESITAPAKPSGLASVVTGSGYSYSTGGAVSSLGHDIQYQLFWGDGSNSPWLAVGTTSASHTWMGAGTYVVTAQARCHTDSQVMSPVSPGLPVTVANGETVSAPSAPSGPAGGAVGTTYTYSTGGAAASSGDAVVYLFDWGDGTTSGWLTAGRTTAAHAWTTAGTYTVTVTAADQYYLLVQSSPSGGLAVQIQ